MNSNLIILAYCEPVMAVLAELALDCGYAPPFTIVENMRTEKGRYAIEVPGVQYQFIDKAQWRPSGEDRLALSVVGPASKEKVFSEFFDAFSLGRDRYPDLVHPTSYVARTCVLDGGLQLEPFSMIAAHTRVGFAVNIKRSVTIGHHVRIEDYATINAGVNIASEVVVGKGVMIGLGAAILEGVEIGAGSIVGAGSVVTKSVPENVVAYGNPCRVVRPVEAKMKGVKK
jgi:sugar O-acyltransferase (sialic acid O-acetyltransferase NeuD family)